MVDVSDYLEEAVIDEKKIMTFKGLSRSMDIDFDLAIQQLTQFVQKKKDDVNAIYFLSGVLKKNGTIKVTLVREEDVERAKKHFEHIYTCHVYSIQCTHLLDLGAVYAADLEGDRKCIQSDQKYLKIHCEVPEVVLPRPPVTLLSGSSNGLTNGSIANHHPPTSSSSLPDGEKISSKVEKKTSEASESRPATSSKQTVDKKPTTKKGQKKPGKDIAALLTRPVRSTEKKAEETTSKTTEKEESSKATKEKTTPESMDIEETKSHMHRTAKRTRVFVESDDDIFAADDSSPEKEERLSPRRSPRRHPFASPSPKKTKIDPKSKAPTTKRNLNQEKKMKDTGKKEKSTSGKKKGKGKEEEEKTPEETEESDDEIVEATPGRKPACLDIPIVIKKKQETVKQFVDDEGFMVVERRQETVLETQAPTAPEPSPTKNTRSNKPSPKKAAGTKKKNSKPSPKKQASLTSFFNKK